MIDRLRRAAAGWSEDDAWQFGAALAYFTLFSLAPLLILTVAVIGAVYGEEGAKKKVVDQIEHLVDKENAKAAQTLLDNFGGSRSLGGMSAVGVVTLVLGAGGMFQSLRNALHRIWRIDTRQESFWWSTLKTYTLAMLMVVVACVFVLALLVVSALLPQLVAPLTGRLASLVYLGPLIDLGVSVLLLTALFAVTFRVLSDRRLTYRQVGFGAFVSAVLFAVGKIALGYYFAFVNVASGFGAAGGLVVSLAWVYYSSQIVFYGAEVVRFGLPEPKA